MLLMQQQELSGSGGYPADAYVLEIDTTLSGGSLTNQYTVYTSGTGYNYNLTSNDGHNLTGLTGDEVLTFSSPGIYTIIITGTFPKLSIYNNPDVLKIIKILQVGNPNFSSNQASQLRNFAFNKMPVSVDWSFLTVGDSMFRGVSGTIPEGWDFPNLTSSNAMFRQCYSIIELSNSMKCESLINAYGMFQQIYGLKRLGGMKFSLCNNMRFCFNNSKLDTDVYSQLLIDLESLNPNNNVWLSANTSNYDSSAVSARANLISRGWIIEDGGLI